MNCRLQNKSGHLQRPRVYWPEGAHWEAGETLPETGSAFACLFLNDQSRPCYFLIGGTIFPFKKKKNACGLKNIPEPFP